MTDTILKVMPSYKELLNIRMDGSSQALITKRGWQQAPGTSGGYTTMTIQPQPENTLPAYLFNDDQTPLCHTETRATFFARYINENGVQFTARQYSGRGKNFTNIAMVNDTASDGSPYSENPYELQRFFSIPEVGTFVEAIKLQPHCELRDCMLESIHEYIQEEWGGDSNFYGVLQEILRENFSTYYPPDDSHKKVVFRVGALRNPVWSVPRLEGSGMVQALHLAQPYEFVPQSIQRGK